MAKAWQDEGEWQTVADQSSPVTMSIEAPEAFEHPVGFVRLRERHRVKAVSRKIVENHSR